MNINNLFGWKSALIVETVFFFLALLQEYFYLGLLWVIVNCFTIILLLRASYSDMPSSRLMAWYIYCLSMFTDLISLCVFGSDLSDGGSLMTFVLVMAIFLLLPKPIFAFFLHQSMKSQGIDIYQGLKLNPVDHNKGASKKNVYKTNESNVNPNDANKNLNNNNDNTFNTNPNVNNRVNDNYGDPIANQQQQRPLISNNAQQATGTDVMTPGQFE